MTEEERTLRVHAAIQGGGGVMLATGRSDNLEAAIDLVLDHLKDSSTPPR